MDSASWYLGYVEDGESVEMIEKKFEALEELNKQITTDGSAPLEGECEGSDTNAPKLSEQQMEDMFKKTSYFSLQEAASPPIDISGDENSGIETNSDIDGLR